MRKESANQAKSSKAVTSGALVDFSLKNDRITTGKEIISPRNESNRQNLDDDLYEDNPNYDDKKNNNDDEDEDEDLPLMRVRRLSFKSKEMGKLRSTIKLKGMAKNGPVIDEAKAQQAAESYFKKRQQFLKSNGVRTDTDFRKNRILFDKLKIKNKEEKPQIKYTAIATENNNNLNKNIARDDEKNKNENNSYNTKYIHKRYIVKNSNDNDNDIDIDDKNEENERNFANKYARYNNNNESNNNKTVDLDNNSGANKFYRRVKPTNIEKNNTETKGYVYKKNDDENDNNKRIYVKKAEFTENKKVEPISYRRRYNNPIGQKVINETEIEISIKPKIDEDSKTSAKTTTSRYYNRVRVNKGQGKDTKKEDDSEQKKIVVNTSGFGRWKRY